MDSDSRPAAEEPLVQRIDALRQRGAARTDPLRWARIEALARRRAALPAPARRLVDERLEQALDDWQRAVDRALPRPQARTDAPGALGNLVGQFAAEAGDAGGAPTDLRSLQRLRSRWERLSVEQRLAGAPARAPLHAGPLNSDGLVTRALALMREVSPRYLQRFVAHADALMWLERATGNALLNSPAGTAAPATAAARKTRRKTGGR